MIKLLFSGDFAPLADAADVPGADCSDIREIADECDLHVTNLECPLTSAEMPLKKTGPSVKAGLHAVELLNKAGVRLACLANNHIFDYGEKGLKDTIDICSLNGIDVVGITNTDNKDLRTAIREINGIRIGFLNYCEHEFSVRDRGQPGACGFDHADAYYDIRALKMEVDRVIVIYHGGNEYYPLPRPDLKRDFHFLADIGADAVIGHHTHVVSGIENYGGKPLVYSLGNFFFPYEGEPESWNTGALCRLTIEDTLKAELIPVLQCRGNLRVERLTGNDADAVYAEIDGISAIIADDNELMMRWNHYTSTTGTGLANQILYPTKADKLMRRIPWLRRYVSNPDRLRSFINVLRCKSLEQLLIGNLKSRQ